MAQKNVPVGVKIISVLGYIGAVAMLIIGLMLLLGGGVLTGVIPMFALFGGLVVVTAIVVIALAVLEFFIARGLWKGQQWARIITIVFAIVGVILAIVSMVKGNVSGNIVSLIIELVIGGYLLFSSKVKKAFA